MLHCREGNSHLKMANRFAIQKSVSLWTGQEHTQEAQISEGHF